MRRNATLFVLISLLSGFGSTAMTLAAGIWVLGLTGSVGIAALTGLCIYAPTLAAPWLGALVDRLPRRPLAIWVDLLLAAAMLTLLTVHRAGNTWLIFAVLLARGLSYVLIDAAETAILPSALPMSLLGDVNGWRSSAQEGMKLLAPLAGAGLYAWQGPTPVVLIGVLMPLLTASCYALLRVPYTADDRVGAPAETGGGGSTAGPVDAGRVADFRSAGVDRARELGLAGAGRGEIREGLRALFGNGAVRVPVLVAAAAIGLSGVTNAAVISRVVHGLGLPATYLGFLTTAQGAGSIVSGLVVGRLVARFGTVAVASLGAALFGAGCVASCLPWLPSMIVGSTLGGVGLVWALIAAVTAVQVGTPDRLLGRVSATSNTVMFGPVAVAIPIGAAVVHLGASAVLLVTAGLAVVAAVAPIRARRVRDAMLSG